jgi:hypothetical protein
MDSAFRRNDELGGFRRNEKKGTDPGLRRDDEVRGFRRNEKKRNWIPAFAGMTKWEAFAEMKRKELDPGLRRYDEVGGFRRNEKKENRRERASSPPNPPLEGEG